MWPTSNVSGANVQYTIVPRSKYCISIHTTCKLLISNYLWTFSNIIGSEKCNCILNCSLGCFLKCLLWFKWVEFNLFIEYWFRKELLINIMFDSIVNSFVNFLIYNSFIALFILPTNVTIFLLRLHYFSRSQYIQFQSLFIKKYIYYYYYGRRFSLNNLLGIEQRRATYGCTIEYWILYLKSDGYKMLW